MSRVLFGGKALREPTAASRLRVGVQPAVNPNATNRVAVIGPADGGVPQQVYTLGSFADAQDVLRGGDSLRAISYIFNPSPAFQGAAEIDFIRADQATAGTLDLTDSDVSPKVAFTVTSVDRGDWVNGIQVRVTDTFVGSGTVTVATTSLTFSASQDGVIDVGDTVTVGANSYTISARVSGTVWTISGGSAATDQAWSYTSLTKRGLVVKVPGATIQNATDGIASTSGSDQLFSSPTAKFITRGAKTGDAIVIRASDASTVTIYTIAQVVSETQVKVTETVTPGSALIWSHVSYIRTQESPQIVAVPGSVNVNANFVTWLNDNAGDVLTAALGAPDALLVEATTGNNPLLGGTVTAMTLQDIEDALVLLRTRQVQHIYVARACGTGAGELSFAGALTGHILNEAETPALAYVGAAASKTVEDAISYAGVLNSGRLVYVMQSIYDSAIDGLGTEEVPGYLAAAKVAGLAAGLPAQTPLTRKPIAMLGLVPLPGGRVLDKRTREELLAAGILHFYQPTGSNTFVINQGVTTLQKNDTLWDATTATSSEISLMRIVDSILTDLRLSAADTFIGATSTLAKPVVEHFVQSYLQSQVGDLLQSYESVTVTQNQDTWYVQFGIVPAYPINFVLITGTVIA